LKYGSTGRWFALLHFSFDLDYNWYRFPFRAFPFLWIFYLSWLVGLGRPLVSIWMAWLDTTPLFWLVGLGGPLVSIWMAWLDTTPLFW
jgi:hypothetical protein